MLFIESEHLQTMFSEDDVLIESDKQFDNSCKTNIQEINATVTQCHWKWNQFE